MKRTIGLYLDENVLKELRPMTDASGRSLSQYINRLLRFWPEMQHTMSVEENRREYLAGSLLFLNKL